MSKLGHPNYFDLAARVYTIRSEAIGSDKSVARKEGSADPSKHRNGAHHLKRRSRAKYRHKRTLRHQHLITESVEENPSTWRLVDLNADV